MVHGDCKCKRRLSITCPVSLKILTYRTPTAHLAGKPAIHIPVPGVIPSNTAPRVAAPGVAVIRKGDWVAVNVECVDQENARQLRVEITRPSARNVLSSGADLVLRPVVDSYAKKVVACGVFVALVALVLAHMHTAVAGDVTLAHDRSSSIGRGSERWGEERESCDEDGREVHFVRSLW